jgi:hypothetical protein
MITMAGAPGPPMPTSVSLVGLEDSRRRAILEVGDHCPRPSLRLIPGGERAASRRPWPGLPLQSGCAQSGGALPRQQRQLPRGINRFNYWAYAFAFPEAAASPRPASAWQLETAARDAMRARFRCHLAGSCGAVGCVADSRIARRPNARLSIALVYYIDTDSLWSQDAEAQRVLKGLPAGVRVRLRKRDAAKWRQRRRGLEGLLEKIKRDQLVFTSLQDQILAGQRRPDELHQMLNEERIRVGDIAVSPAAAQRIWREYHAVGLWLLGRSRREAALRRAAERLTSSVDREARLVQITRPDGRLATALVPGSRQPRPAKVRQDQPPCRDWPEVYDWLALARRNLTRFKNGHRPLLWRPGRRREAPAPSR